MARMDEMFKMVLLAIQSGTKQASWLHRQRERILSIQVLPMTSSSTIPIAADLMFGLVGNRLERLYDLYNRAPCSTQCTTDRADTIDIDAAAASS